LKSESVTVVQRDLSIASALSTQYRCEHQQGGPVSEQKQLGEQTMELACAGDGEAWARTFTPDGVFAGNFKGHDALVGFVNTWRTNPAMNGALRRHFSADLVITATAEGATASVSTLLVDLSTKPVSIANFVTYADVLVKTSEGWRFKSRAVKAEGPPAPAAAAPTAPAAK
jgi:hypothetical protein